MPTGLFQSLQQEAIDLEGERDALLSAVESRAANGGARGFTDDERTRLSAIKDRLGQVRADLDIVGEQRERSRHAEPVASAAAALASAVGSSDTAPTPFRSLGEQMRAVAMAAKNPAAAPHSGLTTLNDWYSRQAAALGANELVGNESGFLVQTDLATVLLESVFSQSILAGRCDRRPIGPNANGTKFNAIDETSRVDGSRWGGVRAYWTAEAGSLTATKPKYAQTQLDLQKLTGLYYATDEELADTTNLEANASAAFSDEFGFKLDDAIVRGTGAGMPLGWLNSSGTVSVSKETNQAATTIVAENIEKMYSRAFARSAGRAVWYINQDCWPQLFQLSHAVGTGGVPIYLPANGLSGAPFGTLLGRPVQPIEQAATVGTVGDITFADLSQYLLIEKGGIAQASSIHVAFLTDETAFRWVLRINGRPKRDSAVTPFKGSNTQSAFITLATRS